MRRITRSVDNGSRPPRRLLSEMTNDDRSRAKRASGAPARRGRGLLEKFGYSGRVSLSLMIEESRLLRVVLAIMSGAALAFSFADFHIAPLVFVALAPLIAAVVASASRTEAFFLATLSSTVTWLINVPWVVIVMSLHGGLALPIGVVLYLAMAIYLGLYAGLFFGLPIRMLRLDERFAPWLLAPACWTVAEYARSHLLTGFPWNLSAAALVDLPAFAQPAMIIGPFGLGFFVVVPATILVWMLMSRAPRGARVRAAITVVVLLVVWGVGGSILLRKEEERVASETRIPVALVQPNISQEMRWGDASIVELYQRMMALTEKGTGSGAKLVVWPESSIPLSFATVEFYRHSVEALSRETGADVILGSVAVDHGVDRKVWNSAYLVSGGETIGRYDKIHLVPFGEYVPARKLLGFARKLVHEVGEFQFGTNDSPLRGRSAYGLAICYEVAFPQLTAEQVRNGAEVLVTITNDGWFGRSAAPEQHLQLARLRAIEDRRWVLRSATTGISALIDPTGRVVSSLSLEQMGVITGGFTPRSEFTPYVRFGDWFAWLAVAALVAGLALRRPRRRR